LLILVAVTRRLSHSDCGLSPHTPFSPVAQQEDDSDASSEESEVDEDGDVDSDDEQALEDLD